jgi:hypothetical protein
LIRWLLEQLEKDPTTLFSKRDLLTKSQSEFEQLKQRGLLVYVQTDPECDTYPCRQSCARACPKQIVETQGQFYAICPEDSEIDPVLLGEDDLHKYAFSIDKLLKEIRKANHLEGSLSRIDPDYIYFGCTQYEGWRVGFVFVFSMRGKGHAELCGLKKVCADDHVLIVLSPVSTIEDISSRAGLGRERVSQTSLAASLDFDTLALPIDRFITAFADDDGEDLLPPTKPLVRGATKWDEVSMEVVDDDTIKIKVGAMQWRKLTYVELGFKDERTGMPNKLWGILLSLADQNRRVVNTPKITPKDIQRLRNTLRSVFGLTGMPIKRYDQTDRRYPCHFRFTDPRNG